MRLLAAAVLLGLAASVFAAPPAPGVNDSTTFFALFRTTARPEFALSRVEFSGNATVGNDGDLRFLPHTFVRYALDERTFPAAKGTLSIAFRARDEFDRLLSVTGGPKDYLNVNRLANGRLGAAMSGTSKGEAAWGRVDYLPDEGFWRSGWHTLTVNWSGEGLALFVDGVLLGRSEAAAPMAKGPKDLRIGGGAFDVRQIFIGDDLRSPRDWPRDAGRVRQNLAHAAWPLLEPEGVYRATWRPPGKEALHVAVKHYADDLDPGREPDWGSAAEGIRLRAAAGETEPACLVVYATEARRRVRVAVLGVDAEVRRVVRAPMRRIYSGKPEDFEIVGRFLPRLEARDLPAGEFMEVWLTFHVPKGETPGLQRGEVHVIAEGGTEISIPLSLEALPFALTPAAKKRMGMYYRARGLLVDLPRLRSELLDLRAHEVTDLVLDVGLEWSRSPAGEIRCDDSELRRVLSELVRAGFRDTVVVQNGLVRLAALAKGHEELVKNIEKGAALLRDLRKAFPQLTIATTHMDEVFNGDRFAEYVALAEAARRAGMAPLYITFHTRDEEADRLRKLLDPHVDIRGHHGYTFEWWLARGHTMSEYRKELAESGDEAWIYHNVRGSYFPAVWGRIINGLYLKASPFTLNAPWIYRSCGGNPFDDTDSERHDFGFAFWRGGDLTPTRVYECLREGTDDCRYLMLLEKTALRLRAERPRDAQAALEFLRRVESQVTETKLEVGEPGTRGEAPLIDALSRSLDGRALDEIRREAADRIVGLLHAGSLAIRALDADGKPLPRVLVSVTGENGAPVRDLYDKGFDPDAEGRVRIDAVPGGRYSVRLHRELTFQQSEGYDTVAVATVDVFPRGEPAVVEARLFPGGRMRVRVTGAGGRGIPARLRVFDAQWDLVSASFWRGGEGGWTTEHLALLPGATSCVLPPGHYRVEAMQIGKVVASGEVEVAAGETADLHLTVQ